MRFSDEDYAEGYYEEDEETEELSDEEKEFYFAEASMTSKDEILTDIKYRKRELQNKAETDAKHSSAFYHVTLTLLDRFYTSVEKTRLFYRLEPFWSYTYEISSDGIALSLSHCDSVSFDKDHNISSCFVDEEFELLRIDCRMLTIDEYAQIYGLENGTVRQWIRRGKIRTAKKLGNEWRIPELTDFPSTRGYTLGQYKWGSDALFPEEYDFFKEYQYATLSQDEKDKSLFRVSLNGRDKPNKSWACTSQERENIELMLISNPFVKYISTTFECYS